MEEKSRLIKLMANFPACDLREAYFQRWKEIFSEAVEFENELTALRSWKEKARPWIEAQCEEIGEALAMRGGFKEDGFMTQELHAAVTKDLEENHKELTELLGGEDEN